jgi:hypothetical protein
MAEAKKRGRKKVRYEAPKMNFGNVVLKAADYQRQLSNALHFAQYEMNNKTLAKNVFEYARTKKASKAEIAALRALDERRLDVLGKYATILVGGGELTPEVMKGFEKLWGIRVDEGAVIVAARKTEAKQAEATTTRKVTVQDRMREQAAEVASTFDAWLDELATKPRAKTEHDPLKLMQKADFKAGQARHMASFYEGELAELKEAIAGKDADLKEGYSNLKPAQLKRMVKLMEDILAACKLLQTVTKAKRKVRAKKAVSLDKQVARIKFKQMDTDFGIASVSPTQIVGAKEVWTFNTKYRKLGRFVAKDDAGLGVKGSNITDFNEVTSVQKSLRKPPEQIKELMKAGKVQLRKFMESIKGVEHKMKARTNEHMVILRVVK